MPPTNSPTLRQRRLGAELRKLRERAGLTATGAGELLGVNQSRVSMIETGRTPISADRLRSMAHVYDCADEALIDALAAMTGRRARGWWEEYRDHLPGRAGRPGRTGTSRLRTAGGAHDPYSRAVADHRPRPGHLPVGSARRCGSTRSSTRLTHRMKRQGVLHRADPPPVHGDHPRVGTSHELRRPRRSSEAAQAPARHERTPPHHRSSHHLRSGRVPDHRPALDYVEGPVPQLDTVQLDSHHGACEFIDAEAQLNKYRAVLNRMESCALHPADTRDFIHHHASRTCEERTCRPSAGGSPPTAPTARTASR